MQRATVSEKNQVEVKVQEKQNLLSLNLSLFFVDR